MLESEIGIPQNLFRDFDVTVFTKPIEFNDHHYNADIQNKVFLKTVENPFDKGAYVFLLSVESNNSIAQTAAKTLLKSAIDKGAIGFWFNILNFKSCFERLKSIEAVYGGLDFLVIDGVFMNTNKNNLDSLRYLLSIYSTIPVCVVISGIDGASFFKQSVFCGFNKFIHFSDIPSPRNVLNMDEIDNLDDLPDID